MDALLLLGSSGFGSLADFSAAHAGDRFFCETGSSYTLYAVSRCAEPASLAVSIRSHPSEANLAFCEAYEEAAQDIVSLIVGALVFLAVCTAFCAGFYTSDTVLGKKLRDCERRCMAAITCGYLGGLACCRKRCEPKAEKDLRGLQDCECIGCMPPLPPKVVPEAERGDSVPTGRTV